MPESGSFTITPDHPCLAGHFPGQPVVPGCVLLDHAITEACRTGACDQPVRYIARVKFLRPVLPGQSVQVRADLQGDRLVLRCAVGGKAVLDARCALGQPGDT